jgi:hypothetical protein
MRVFGEMKRTWMRVNELQRVNHMFIVCFDLWEQKKKIIAVSVICFLLSFDSLVILHKLLHIWKWQQSVNINLLDLQVKLLFCFVFCSVFRDCFN